MTFRPARVQGKAYKGRSITFETMGTRTARFGTSKRDGHDASTYYERRMARAKTRVTSPHDSTTVTTPTVSDRIFCHSSEEMHELPDNCVALAATSPPYNVGKEYDDDVSFEDYLGLLERVFRETYRVLQPGGRLCVNVANVGRKPYIPLTSYVNMLMLDIGFLMRGEIIWVKAKGASGSCAWGSWCSARNPVLRDIHEYVLVFSKVRFDRGIRGMSTLGPEEFMRDTLSVWQIPPASARKVGHPAPFPIELPRRLIELYSFRGDLVLDPFCGAGTTCVAAKQTGRRYIGYEVVPNYVGLAERRLKGGATSADKSSGCRSEQTKRR